MIGRMKVETWIASRGTFGRQTFIHCGGEKGLKLEQSRTQVKSSEELVRKLQADLLSNANKNILGSTNENGPFQENGENEEINQLRVELIFAKTEENQYTKKESELVIELKKLDAIIVELKAKILDRETELQNIAPGNNMCKMEIKEELEKNEITGEVVASVKAARAVEQEALTKLGHITEEPDKSNKRVAQVTEQY
ncbi:Interactor of constitutive active ROPs 2 [Spatholobus suberectus]|nr:Interactor of constitutive active ROPs 2 [Spatholobus suberectus]